MLNSFQFAAIIDFKSLINFIVNKFKFLVFLLFLMGLFLNLFNSGIGFFSNYLFSHPVSTNNHYLPIILTGILLLTAIASFNYFYEYCLRLLTMRLLEQAMPQVFDHLLKLPLKSIKNYSAADLTERLQYYESALYWLVKIILTLFFAGFTFSVLFLYLFFCDSKLACFYLLIIIITLIIKLYLLSENLKQLKIQFIEKSKLTVFVQEILLQIHKIRSTCLEVIIFNKWLAKILILNKSSEKNNHIETNILLCEAILSSLLFLVLLVIVYFSENINITLLLQFILCANQFTILLERLSQDTLAALHFIPALQRLKPLLAQSKEPLINQLICAGEIEFSSLRFKHPETSKIILDQLHLKIPAGTFIIITGASGSGKSTLCKLLLGLEQPTSGMILLDKENIQFINRQSFGVVLQHSQLFPGTILSNININQNLSIEEVWELAEKIDLANDVAQMPMRMLTTISDNIGDAFSGGQKQKILLARALAQQPKILLLDEATSALDNESEKIIYTYLKTLTITRIIITHKLTYAHYADKIYRLEMGKLIDYQIDCLV